MVDTRFALIGGMSGRPAFPTREGGYYRNTATPGSPARLKSTVPPAAPSTAILAKQAPQEDRQLAEHLRQVAELTAKNHLLRYQLSVKQERLEKLGAVQQPSPEAKKSNGFAGRISLGGGSFHAFKKK